ncbi:hypothetical protein [Actinomycetospora aeridis]|uniref:WD40 repeat protein n=1 Tax=Actinomycetospora aeridis TaxID=3129231 RepID=A0ABU8N1F4_9PSEU
MSGRGEIWLGDVVRAWEALGGDRDAVARVLGFVPEEVRPPPASTEVGGSGLASGPADLGYRAPTPRPRASAARAEPTATPFRPATRYARHLRPAGTDVRARVSPASAILSVVTGHAGPVRAVAFSPDGRTLATAGAGEIRRWSAHTGVSVGPPLPLAGEPSCLAVGDDGSCWVATADGPLEWTATPGDRRGVDLYRVSALAAAGEGVVIGTRDGALLTIGARPAGRERPAPRRPWPGNRLRGPIVAVAASARGGRIAVVDAGGEVVTVSDTGIPRAARFAAMASCTLDADGDELTMVFAAGQVRRVDTTTLTGGSATGPELPSGVPTALAPGGGTAATANPDGSVTVHRLAVPGSTSGPAERVLARPARGVRAPLPLEPLLAPHLAPRLLEGLLAVEGASDAVDAEALVDLVARRAMVTPLPRRRRRSLLHGVQVVVDDAPGTARLRRDVEEVLGTLRRVVGAEAVDVRRIVATPYDERTEDYALPPPGRPVLALSDLGIAVPPGAPRGPRQLDHWRRFARELHARGSHAVVLVPYPPARWPSATGLPTLVTWDRVTRAARAAPR